MADQGIGVLGQAISQATNIALTGAQREEELARKQGKVDAANDIISGALKLNDRLVKSGKTPFVVQRDIYRYITLQESDAGLATGSAMTSYKQFFGAQTGVDPNALATSGADIKKNYDKIAIPGVGVQWTNPATGHTFTTKITQDNIDAQAVADTEKAKQLDTLEILKSRGVLNGYTAEEIKFWETNPDKAPEKVKRIFKDVESQATIESRLDRNKVLYENTEFKDIEVLRDEKAPDALYNTATDIIETSLTDKEYTLDQALVALNKEIGNKRKEVSPKVYDAVFGDLPKILTDMVTQAHPDTKSEYDTKRFKTREEALKSKLSIVKSVYKFAAYGDNPSLVSLDVAIDSVRGVNPNAMNILMQKQGVQKTTEALSGILFAVGKKEFDRLNADQGVYWDKSFKDMDKEEVDVDGNVVPNDKKDSKILDIISTALQFNPGQAQDPMQVMSTNKALNLIKFNKTYKASAIKECDRLLDILGDETQIDRTMKGKILQFKTALEAGE
jgi:hypothetical protein